MLFTHFSSLNKYQYLRRNLADNLGSIKSHKNLRTHVPPQLDLRDL
jgi:hypothetical protein